MKIVKATTKHLPEINKLNKTYFKEVRDFAKVITGPNDYFYVATQNEKVIGFSGFHYYAWNNTASIIDIFIHPKLRGRGYGDKLVKKIISQVRLTKARAIIAEAPSLSGVLTLYLKNNFRICGFNDRYYDNQGREIAFFVAKDLK